MSQGTASLWDCDSHWKMYSKNFYKRDFSEKKEENYSTMDSEKEGAWRKIWDELRDRLGLGW